MLAINEWKWQYNESNGQKTTMASNCEPEQERNGKNRKANNMRVKFIYGVCLPVLLCCIYITEYVWIRFRFVGFLIFLSQHRYCIFSSSSRLIYLFCYFFYFCAFSPIPNELAGLLAFVISVAVVPYTAAQTRGQSC